MTRPYRIYERTIQFVFDELVAKSPERPVSDNTLEALEDLAQTSVADVWDSGVRDAGELGELALDVCITRLRAAAAAQIREAEALQQHRPNEN